MRTEEYIIHGREIVDKADNSVAFASGEDSDLSKTVLLVKKANYHDELVGSNNELLAIVQRYEPHTAGCATQADAADFGHLGCTCEHGKIVREAKTLLAKIERV